MPRVFTTATDDAIIDMIRSARNRLAIIGPGVTTPVAEAIADRMSDLSVLSLTVILDADPEVYRMGYGDTEALKIIREASKAAFFDLREQPGIRIGVIISDEHTMVYAPVSRNVEAGPSAGERPNAIALVGAVTDAFAVAAGSTPHPEHVGGTEVQQEIGHQALAPKKVEAMEADLHANPPRPFDLTRRLTVFVTEVQFVELRLTNALLSSREVRLPQHFLKFNDARLRQDVKSTLKIPIDLSEKLEVGFTSHLGEEKLKVNEADLKGLRDLIEQRYFYEWKGRGKIILRKDKEQFKKDLERLLELTRAYQESLKSQFQQMKAEFRESVVKEFLDFWKSEPPEHVRLSGATSERHCRQDIEKAADIMFEKAVTLGMPEAKDVYKDISIEDLKDETLMTELRKLMERAGVAEQTLSKLFQSGDAVAVQGSLL
ncbi:hypothetical protein [Hyphomonas sp.]|uniref:hypothetical protein n=1 Tax=Hyphomonas sp. TaxID=87 RepID=UPI0025B8AEA9|nr:hypothetical protein [Hyphomonas sp.]